MRLVDLAQRDPLEDFQGRRRGQREDAVGAMHRPGTIMQAGNEDFLHAERFNPHAGTDHVGNRIQGADLVEVHIVDRLAMDLGFGLGDAMEDGQRVLFDELGEFTLLDQGANLAVTALVLVFVGVPVLVSMLVFVGMSVLVGCHLAAVVVIVFRVGVRVFVVVLVAMLVLVLRVVMVLMAVLVLMSRPLIKRMFMMLVVVMVVVAIAMLVSLALVGCVRRAFVNAKLDAFDFVPVLAVEMHVEIAEVELRELPLERRGFDAKVDERADRHVTGNAGKTVKEEDFHGKLVRKAVWTARRGRASAAFHRRALCR